LEAIDSLVYSDPRRAEDSLINIQVNELSGKNRAYYYLISTILDCKNFRPFTNDSTISFAVKAFESPIPNRNFLRALIYQGVVRYQTGQFADSVVFESLKEAERILALKPGIVSDYTLTYLWLYFGILHRNNDNHILAERYFDWALNTSHGNQQNIESFVNALLGIFWSYLRKGYYEEALSVLNRLDALDSIPPEKQFDVINARGAYHIMNGDNLKAVAAYRQLESLADKVSKKPRMSNIYYSIALAYENMNELDSAIVYATKSVEYLRDTTIDNYDSYFLYAFLADLAFKNEQYRISSMHYKNAFELLLKSLEHKTQKQILELEKKYDLSQARVETLKQRERYQRLVFIGIVSAIVVVFVLLIYYQNLRKSRLAFENERLLRVSAERETENKIRDNQQKQHLLKLYQIITERENNTQKRFDELSQRLVKDNPDIYMDLHEELKRLKSEFFDLVQGLIDDDIFYTHLNIPESISFTDLEKMILFLFYFKMPTSEITKVLGVSSNNLRVRKSVIRKKLYSVVRDYPDVENVILLLSTSITEE
jgi:tetratricopeptide (TPR) repeat protein